MLRRAEVVKEGALVAVAILVPGPGRRTSIEQSTCCEEAFGATKTRQTDRNIFSFLFTTALKV